MSGDEYGWIANTGLSMAATLTLVRGLSEEQVVDAFGAGRDPVLRRDITGPGAGSEAYAEDEDERIGGFVWITPVDDWWLIAEDNDFFATLDETITALRASRQVSVMWNINLLTRVVSASNGVIDRDDELDLSSAPTVGEAALLLLERETGMQVTEEVLTRPQIRLTVSPAWDSGMRAPDSSTGLIAVSAAGMRPEWMQEGTVMVHPFGQATVLVPNADAPEWVAAPANWLPGIVPLPALDAFGTDVAVRLIPSGAYPQGLLLQVEIRGREAFGDWSGMPFGLPRVDGSPQPALEVRASTQDGSSCVASVVPPDDAQPDMRLTITNKDMTGYLMRCDLWLWPLPPSSLTLEMGWRDREISPVSVEYPGDVIREAADRAVRLWA